MFEMSTRQLYAFFYFGEKPFYLILNGWITIKTSQFFMYIFTKFAYLDRWFKNHVRILKTGKSGLC